MRVDPLLAKFEATKYALSDCVFVDSSTIAAKLRDFFEVPEDTVLALLDEVDRIRAEHKAAASNGWHVERAGKSPEAWTATKHCPVRGRISERGSTVSDVLRSTRLADADSAGREVATPKPRVLHDGRPV